jgi:116 kDa U5 small nuclear ribonucleoprotein component N-terminus
MSSNDDELYDEFGNYIGPDLDDSDEDEADAEHSDDEGNPQRGRIVHEEEDSDVEALSTLSRNQTIQSETERL